MDSSTATQSQERTIFDSRIKSAALGVPALLTSTSTSDRRTTVRVHPNAFAQDTQHGKSAPSQLTVSADVAFDPMMCRNEEVRAIKEGSKDRR